MCQLVQWQMRYFYLFSFKEDMIEVFLDGPRFFDKGCCDGLSFCKWKPGFNPVLDLGKVASM